MKLTLSIPDDLYEEYQGEAMRSRIGVTTLLVDRLLRFKGAKTQDRTVLIETPERVRLETLLGYGSLLSGPDLVEKVQRLADCHIGEIRVDFSPAEWQEIAQRAMRRGISVQEEVSQTVAHMKGNYFTYAGGV
jgi:hypothetical protein